MKILDRYILTTYLKTFISVFVILMMIFVLQTIWLYIKELAGKDLDIVTVFKFLIYFTPKLIPLVLPLTILLSSIMVFGNFAENYEFAAMKSTGISLQRAMRGLSVFVVVLGILTFFFANNVIPSAEYNSYNLRKNIAKLKPAMVIAEGQFNEVGDINIKVEEKSGDRGQFLKDITIHKKASNGKGNHITIKAKTGELISAETSDVLQLVLFDGNYYDDTPPTDRIARQKRPFVKSFFEKYTINIDLNRFNEQVDLDAKNYSDKHTMLNVNDLSYTIDSLSTQYNSERDEFAESLHTRSGIVGLSSNLTPKGDTIYTGEIMDVFDQTKTVRLIDIALNTVTSTSKIIEAKDSQLKGKSRNINMHVIALHEKFSIAFACIILFFVGAPLGALIRKGGLGLPMVIAILLFLTYHFIGIFAKNSAKNGSFNLVLATWFSTLIMLPLGIYLTKRATADRGLFELGNFMEPIKKFLNIKTNDSDDNKYQFFKGFTNEKLLGIIKNHQRFDYEPSSKFVAINTLMDRGMTLKDLKINDIKIDTEYDHSLKLYGNHKDFSNYAMLFYISGVVLLILFFIFKNNKLPSLASMSIQLSIISFVVLCFYYVATFINLSRLSKHTKQPHRNLSVLLLILGLPLYPLIHFYNKKKAETYLQLNCLDSIK